jgi:hypothetical protein
MWLAVCSCGIASTVDPEQFRLPVVLTSKSYGTPRWWRWASALSALLVRRLIAQDPQGPKTRSEQQC